MPRRCCNGAPHSRAPNSAACRRTRHNRHATRTRRAATSAHALIHLRCRRARRRAPRVHVITPRIKMFTLARQRDVMRPARHYALHARVAPCRAPCRAPLRHCRRRAVECYVARARSHMPRRVDPYTRCRCSRAITPRPCRCCSASPTKDAMSRHAMLPACLTCMLSGARAPTAP